MSIRQRYPGVKKSPWIVTYSVFDEAKKKRVRKQRTFRTKEKAQEFDANRIAMGGDKIISDRDSITLGEASEIWLTAVAAGRGRDQKAEPATLRAYRGHLRNHVFPHFGSDKKLTKISTASSKAFLDHLRMTMSAAQAGHVFTSFKALLTEAQSRGLLVVNPAQALTAGSRKAKSRHKAEQKFPKRVEIAKIEAALDRLATQSNKQSAKAWRFWRAYFRTAIETGMRQSELRGVPWASVDLKAGKIKITQRADEKGRIGPPKSASGYRTIRLPDDLIQLLREWKLESSGELVFGAPTTGEPRSPSYIWKRGWFPLMKEAGLLKDQDKVNYRGKPLLTPNFNQHMLRHFHATELIADGARPDEIKQELGHAGIQLTFDTYGHYFRDPDAEERQRERANRLRAQRAALAAAELDAT